MPCLANWMLKKKLKGNTSPLVLRVQTSLREASLKRHLKLCCSPTQLSPSLLSEDNTESVHLGAARRRPRAQELQLILFPRTATEGRAASAQAQPKVTALAPRPAADQPLRSPPGRRARGPTRAGAAGAPGRPCPGAPRSPATPAADGPPPTCRYSGGAPESRPSTLGLSERRDTSPPCVRASPSFNHRPTTMEKLWSAVNISGVTSERSLCFLCDERRLGARHMNFHSTLRLKRETYIV